MLFYFTATGNCLYVAKQLEDNLYSIPPSDSSRKLNI